MESRLTVKPKPKIHVKMSTSCLSVHIGDSICGETCRRYEEGGSLFYLTCTATDCVAEKCPQAGEKFLL